MKKLFSAIGRYQIEIPTTSDDNSRVSNIFFKDMSHDEIKHLSLKSANYA